MSIPVFRSYIRRKDMDTVLNCLVTDSVGAGEYVDRFQKSARESLGFDFCVALRSPGIALGLAIDSLGLSEGDSIAVSALAPSYYSKVLASRRLTAVFVDTLPDSVEPDLQSLLSMESKPKAFILYDALGMLPDSEDMAALGVPIVEDMSCALGAYRGEARAGSFGRIAFMGLEHDSIVTSGGGALIAACGRRDGIVLRNLAESLDSELRMTDYNAALGFAQLRDMESTIAKRRELAIVFAQSIARTRHRMLAQGGEGEPGYWALPVSIVSGVKDVQAYASKKEVDTELAFERSLVASGIVPEHLCQNARSLAKRCLVFPLHQRMGASMAQKLAKVLATLP